MVHPRNNVCLECELERRPAREPIADKMGRRWRQYCNQYNIGSVLYVRSINQAYQDRNHSRPVAPAIRMFLRYTVQAFEPAIGRPAPSMAWVVYRARGLKRYFEASFTDGDHMSAYTWDTVDELIQEMIADRDIVN